MPPRKLSVALSSWAEDDRDDLYVRGLEEWGSRQADAYLEKILAALERLAEYPEIGAIRYDVRPGVRGLPVEQHVIYYVCTPVEIQVGRILHARQDPSAAPGI